MIRKLLGLVAGLSALTACDEGPASNLSFTTTPDVWSFVTAAATGGPLPVEIHGNPFGDPPRAVAREVAMAADRAFTEPWLRLAATREADREALRLIWMLDVGRGFNADDVCRGRLPAVDAGRRVVDIRAVLCQGERPLSAVHGWMRNPGSASDPSWRNLTAQMARQLLTGRG
jgi:hypothetical protein